MIVRPRGKALLSQLRGFAHLSAGSCLQHLNFEKARMGFEDVGCWSSARHTVRGGSCMRVRLKQLNSCWRQSTMSPQMLACANVTSAQSSKVCAAFHKPDPKADFSQQSSA